MRYDLDEIQRLPDVLSLADLCRACHLSHLDARYYLKSGLIPYETTGKKTRCYLVKIQNPGNLERKTTLTRNPQKPPHIPTNAGSRVGRGGRILPK